jgi:hypothetical protein
MKQNAVVYRGPSLLTGDPILVAVSGLAHPSMNPKTGPMLQAWILRSDMKPNDAVRVGADDAICGACPLRSPDGHTLGRACYVTVWQSPLNVYRSLALYRDIEPRALSSEIGDRAIRLGAYGDPAAVPTHVWRDLLVDARRWTGYTHQWRSCDQSLSQFLMASVDTPQEAREAQAMGWRTFRVRTPVQAVAKNEAICPASTEGGHATTCEQCGLCRGRATVAKNVVIVAHGQRARHFNNLALFK